MARALLLLGLAAIAACSDGQRRVIVAGEEGTEPALRAVASALRDRAGMQSSVASMPDATAALRRLRSGDAALALVTADALADAVNGQGAFRGETVPARAILTLADAGLHLFVLNDSGVGGLSGLRGRRVATGPPGSATELTALRVLREALLDPERDLSRESLSLRDSLTALRERRIDAFFWIGTSPIAEIDQAVSAGGLNLRLVSTASVVTLLQKRFGEALYWSAELPGGAYGSAEAAGIVSTGQVLVARSDLTETETFTMARVLMSSADDLSRAHPSLQDLRSRQGSRPSPAALHPGAARYLRQWRP